MPDEKLTMTIDTAAKLLGISRGLAYEAARTGQIFTIRIGRRYLVPVAWLRKKLETADQSG